MEDFTMKRRQSPTISLNHEFELDLAPLLAVMVKLVPVLITSSAFIPVVVIPSQLPAPIVQALEVQNSDKAPRLELRIHPEKGIDLQLSRKDETVDSLHMNYPVNSQDFNDLNTKLTKLKIQAPELFRLELLPEGSVPYDTLIKIMDTARKSSVPNQRFKFQNPENGVQEETDFMYPDVIFGNILEG